MKILLLGANGQVGWQLRKSLAIIGEVKACGKAEANLENHDYQKSVYCSLIECNKKIN